ncbi:MAG: hypothetical protein ACLRSW_16815 [Christensenellaceae bacterium]
MGICSTCSICPPRTITPWWKLASTKWRAFTIDGQNGMPVIETQKLYDLYAEKYGTEEDRI